MDGLSTSIPHTGSRAIWVCAPNRELSLRFAITALDVAIEMRGLAGIVQALTGDLVLSDADGAIIVPGGLAQHVIDATEKAAAVNAQVRAEILRGVPRLQATRKYKPE